MEYLNYIIYQFLELFPRTMYWRGLLTDEKFYLVDDINNYYKSEGFVLVINIICLVDKFP